MWQSNGGDHLKEHYNQNILLICRKNVILFKKMGLLKVKYFSSYWQRKR